MKETPVRIEIIADAVARGRFRVTDHADEEAAKDALFLADVLQSVQEGELIEDYPEDRPFPSCLVLGRTETGNPIHTVWAYNESKQWAVLVTVYQPDPARWTDWRTRKKA